MRLVVSCLVPGLSDGASNAGAQTPELARAELSPMALEAGLWGATVSFPSPIPAAPPTLAHSVHDNTLGPATAG